LPHQGGHRVLLVLSLTFILQNLIGHEGQTHRLIQFPMNEDSFVAGDLYSMKFQLHAAVKKNPQRLFLLSPIKFIRFCCFNLCLGAFPEDCSTLSNL
jgi:hypothetical protein